MSCALQSLREGEELQSRSSKGPWKKRAIGGPCGMLEVFLRTVRASAGNIQTHGLLQVRRSAAPDQECTNNSRRLRRFCALCVVGEICEAGWP